MNIYVAYKDTDGKVAWLCNPKPFFDGRVFIAFTPLHVLAGVPTELFKRGMDTLNFKKVLVDELDRLHVPWADAKNAKIGVRSINKEQHELYVMEIRITGPLSLEWGSCAKGTRKTRCPVKVMVRYGG